MIDYIAWIDEQLAVHEREIAKLTIARDVILAASASPGVPSDTVKRAPGKKNGPGVTQKWVLDALHQLSERGIYKATSSTILATVKGTVGEDVDAKAIYNALYNAVKGRKLVKDGKTFSINSATA